MTEGRSEPVDAAARQRAVHSPHSVLVQAPAGSGKTTLLTQRYLRLLALVAAPERILALTFTRRAAEEMRERVCAALAAAQATACPPGLNPETWRLAVAAARHLQGQGVDLAQHPARLRIETIDAFNAWLAAQLPVASGTGGNLRMQADAGAYLEAARRSLAGVEADGFGEAVEHVLRLGDQRWSQIAALIAGRLPSRDLWLPLLAGSLSPAAAAAPAHLLAVRRQFDADLRALVERSLVGAARALGAERLAALSAILHAAAREPAEAPPNLAAWREGAGTLQPTAADLPRWREALAIVLKVDGELRSTVTKLNGFPAQSRHKGPMQDLLQEWARDPSLAAVLRSARAVPDPCYSDAQWDGVRAAAQVLLLAAAELDVVFRERGEADFPAVSMAARRALGSALAPTDLALRLDYRLQHILVDEFQDTSGAQLALLELLTAGWQQGDGRTVFCVGDPMQAIYGFRAAEVRAFLQLADAGLGGLRFDVQRLGSNFRSAHRVIDWVNATFARILPAADDRERGAIAYRPSAAAAPANADGDAGVEIAAFRSPGAEARAVAERIAAARRDHPGWRIAVLVRARRHVQLLAEALRLRGVAFRAVDIEPLHSRHIVRDLLSLTRALLHLGDRAAWFALLRAPWIGLRLADLHVIARAGGTVWEALGNPEVMGRASADAQQRGARAREVLGKALELRGQSPLARWVERCWLALGGPACAADDVDLDHARSAFERLRSLEERGLPDAAALSEVFADLFARDPVASPVEIMTVHKAKGLEFDFVVLPALERGISTRSDDFLLIHGFVVGDRDAMIMASRPAVGGEEDGLYRFLQRRTREAASLEAERLLYVACTRAKSRLLLSASLGQTPDESDDAEEAADQAGAQASAGWRPRSGSLLAVLWPAAGAEFRAALADETPAPGAAEASLRGGPLRRVPAGWTPPPPAPEGGLAGEPVPLAARDPTPVFDWAGETARHVGLLVHAQLQTLSLGPEGSSSPGARAAQFERWLAARGVPPERLRDAVQRVVDALAAVQGDARGRWILSPHPRDDVREHALSGALNGVVVRVVFDRSFVDADGVRWVIDYKTSQHMGGGEAQFLDREVERYRPQMQRYAALARRLGPEPVRVGLYFPLMRAWREWEP
jgi:ATP-dependent exoDNAse (exonuclease V) beta subunit